MKTQIIETVGLSDVSYAFFEIPADSRCDEVFGYSHFSVTVFTLGSVSPMMTIYATTSQSTDQFTDANKIATVTFGSGSGYITGDVTMIDNGKALSGKSYMAFVFSTSVNKSYTINMVFEPADTVKVETGSGFQECYPMLYTGTEFVPCQVSRYNGTAFERCSFVELE